MRSDMAELIALIENGVFRNLPRCGHCLRTLRLAEKDGQKYLYCKHCEDLAKEEQENPLYWPGEN